MSDEDATSTDATATVDPPAPDVTPPAPDPEPEPPFEATGDLATFLVLFGADEDSQQAGVEDFLTTPASQTVPQPLQADLLRWLRDRGNTIDYTFA